MDVKRTDFQADRTHGHGPFQDAKALHQVQANFTADDNGGLLKRA